MENVLENYAEISTNENSQVWDFKKENSQLCKIDFDEISFENIEIVIRNATKLLIINHKNPKNVHITLLDNSNLILNIMSTEVFTSDNFVFDIEYGAHVDVALADFSFGSGEIKATFNLLKPLSYANWHLASLGTKSDKKVFNINFLHKASDTYANMSNYGVVEDRSHMHFLGVSHIEKGASKSTTHQSAKIMVFDKKCVAKANPILKIDENDIQASHAAAVGKVNDEHMFYLRSRGLHEFEAKQLITLGYLKPITNYFLDEKVSEEISAAIEKQVSL